MTTLFRYLNWLACTFFFSPRLFQWKKKTSENVTAYELVISKLYFQREVTKTLSNLFMCKISVHSYHSTFLLHVMEKLAKISESHQICYQFIIINYYRNTLMKLHNGFQAFIKRIYNQKSIGTCVWTSECDSLCFDSKNSLSL